MPRAEVQLCLRVLAVVTFGRADTIRPIGTAAAAAAATACDSYCNHILRRHVDVGRESAPSQTSRTGRGATAFLRPSGAIGRPAPFQLPWKRMPVQHPLATPAKRLPITRANEPSARTEAAAAEFDGQEPSFPTRSVGFWSADKRSYDTGRRLGANAGGDRGRGLISAEVDSLRRPLQQQQQQGGGRRWSTPSATSPWRSQTRRSLEAHSEEAKPTRSGDGDGEGFRPPRTPNPDAAMSSAAATQGVHLAERDAEEKGRVEPPAEEDRLRLEEQKVAATVGDVAGDGEVVGDVEWDHGAARDRACEELPQLAEAFRGFDEKHPGATIIYLAHSGSRLYGTSTPTSDVDVKGIFIPDTRREKEVRRAAAAASAAAAAQEQEEGGQHQEEKGAKALAPGEDAEADTTASAASSDKTAGEGLSGSPPTPGQAPAAAAAAAAGGGTPKDGKEVTFWYSTGDCASANTMEDIDMELISIGRFFGQLFRGEVGGVETLHSMQAQHVELIRDPEIVPVILRERRWMVSSQLSSWMGFVLSHVSKYRKVTNKEAVARHMALKRKLKRQQQQQQQQQQPGALDPASAAGGAVASPAGADAAVGAGAAAAATTAAAAAAAAGHSARPAAAATAATVAAAAASAAAVSSVPSFGDAGSAAREMEEPSRATGDNATDKQGAPPRDNITGEREGEGVVLEGRENTTLLGDQRLEGAPAAAGSGGAARITAPAGLKSDSSLDEAVRNPDGGVLPRGGGSRTTTAATVGVPVESEGVQQLGAISRAGGNVAAAAAGVQPGPTQTAAGVSSEGGPRLGVISRRVEDRAKGKPREVSPPEGRRKLGVLLRGGVEVVATSDNSSEKEEEEEEEEEEDFEAKQQARKIRRGKLALHARRGVIEAEELLTTGRLTFPLKPRHVTELLRLKELGFHPKKVATIQAQARNLAAIAATSGLPREVSSEKVSNVQAEVMKIHDRRRHRQRSEEGVARD